MAEPPTCVDCAGPRSESSGQRCARCYKLVARAHKLGREARLMAAELDAASYTGRRVGTLGDSDIRTLAPLLKAAAEDLLQA